MTRLSIIKAAIAATSLTILTTVAAQPASAETGASAASPATDSESVVIARSIITIMFPPEHRTKMMDDLMATMMSQMKGSMSLDSIADTGLRQIFLDYLDDTPNVLRPAVSDFLPKQMEAMAQAYAQMFTLDQLNDIAAFAQTPSGRNYLQRSTEVLSNPSVAAVNTEYFRNVGAISQSREAELKTKIAEYLEKHAGAIPGK